MAKGTPLRNIRIADDLWAAAQSVAAKRGENLSQVLRDALLSYITDDEEVDSDAAG